MNLSEDDVYLHTGLHLQVPFTSFQPLLYPAMFWAVFKAGSFAFTTAFNVYFLLSIAAFLALFFFLKSINKYLALVLSGLFLFSDFQINLSPRISILTLSLLLIFLSFSRFSFKKHQKWGLASLCFLICNYAGSPEFFYAFLFSFASFVVFLLREKPKFYPIYFLGFLALISSLYYLAGGIFSAQQWLPNFTLHFFDNYFDWTGKHFDLQEEFAQFEKHFGQIKYDYQLLFSNPPLLIKHVGANIVRYLHVLIDIIKSCFYLPIAYLFGRFTPYFFGALVLVFALFLDFKSSIRNLKHLNFFFDKSFLSLYFVSTLIPIFLIYPRQHYVLLHVPFYLLILAHVVNCLMFKSKKFQNVFAGLLIFSFVGGLYFKPANTFETDRDFYTYISFKTSKGLRICSNDVFGSNYFLNQKSFLVSWDPHSVDLDEELKNKRFDVLLFSKMDLELPSVRSFLEKNDKNFVRVNKFEMIQRYIFVKPNLAKDFL